MRERDERDRPSRPEDADGHARDAEEQASHGAEGLSRRGARDVGNAIADAIRRFGEKPYSREAVVGGALGVAFAVVASRLFYLQTIATGDIATTAKNERTARKVLPHRRGGIYDRNGNVLARSIDAVHIAAHPNLIAEVNATANLLVSVLGGDASVYAELLSRDTTYVYLQKQADPQTAERLKTELAQTNAQRKEAGLEELGGFEFEETSKRVYPMGSVAGTVVGCLDSEGRGLTGLELYYDDVLSGVDGYVVQERSRNGAPVVGGQYERTEPVDGENIVLSLDLDIQRVAQEQLQGIIDAWGAGDGCVIVMDPRSGEIYACCSSPFLDPSDRTNATTEAFNLRCVSDSYEPGSTVKPITASIAIDLGIASPYTSYWAPVRIDVGTDSVGDADDRAVEMDMTLTNVLERSSNVGIVMCAESIGPQNFAGYLERFQIGHLTGVDYPGEALGLVPKLKDYTGAWEAMAFGQSLAVPPIQMARAISAIANEGVLTTPHFMINCGGQDVEYPAGDHVVTTATAEQVAQMMYSVTENGYGSTGRIEGYHLSTKTGTAERVSDTGGYLDGLYTVSFIGFGPTEDPEVLVYVLVDYVPEATGSQAVGSSWAVIMQEALNRLQIPPVT